MIRGTVVPPKVLLAGETVYASQGNVYALHASDGSVYQKYPVSGVVQPVVSDETVYLNMSRYPHYQVVALRSSARCWDYQTEGRLVGSPVLADGVIYVSEDRGVGGAIDALQAENGTLLWRAAILPGPGMPSPVVCAAPIVLGDIVYVAVNSSPQSFLYAFACANGTLLWRVAIPRAGSFPATVFDSSLYFSGPQSCFAVWADTGALLWEQKLGEIVCSRPVISSSGVVYITVTQGRANLTLEESGEIEYWQQALIYAFCAGDGTYRWQQPLAPLVPTDHLTELSSGDLLYVGSNGVLWACRFDGIPVWHYQTGGRFLSTPTGDSKAVYVGADNGCVYALRAKDGTLLWRTFVSTAVTSASATIVGPISWGQPFEESR